MPMIAQNPEIERNKIQQPTDNIIHSFIYSPL